MSLMKKAQARLDGESLFYHVVTSLNTVKTAGAAGSVLGTTLKGLHKAVTSPTANKFGAGAIKALGKGVKGFGKAWDASPTLRRTVGTGVLGAGMGAVPGAIGGALSPGGETAFSGGLRGAVGGGVLGGMAGLAGIGRG